jgi:demethylmenaquinone methyltransferase/2-methoxy-6-polyprenyl-1,4-benzoquinol methylase
MLSQGERKRQMIERMFDRIAPRYDLLNGLISLGAHRRWKRQAVAALAVRPGDVVLDLACGTGDLAIEATRYGGRAIGIDVSAGMLAIARRRDVGARLLRAAAEALPFAAAVADAVVCGFALRNFVEIEPVLAEVARVLRPGGRLAVVEIDRPANPVLQAAHRIYFETLVPLLGALLSDRVAYAYLPSSIAYLPGEAELEALLESAGLTGMGKRRLLGGAAQLVTARKAAPC